MTIHTAIHYGTATATVPIFDGDRLVCYYEALTVCDRPEPLPLSPESVRPADATKYAPATANMREARHG